MKSYILTLSIISFLGLTLLGCKGNKVDKKPMLTSKGAPYAALKMGSCFGKCPVYKMTIFDGGFVEIIDVRNLSFKGAQRKRISQEYMDQLDKAFAKADFASLQAEYPSQLADLPLTRISKFINGEEKLVMGKETLPENVKEVKRLMHAIVKDTEGWTPMEEMEIVQEDTGEELEEEKEKGKIIYNEYIIQPEPGVRLSDWLKKSESLGLKLKKRLIGSNNLWLLICEQDRYAPAELLKMLQDDPEIRMAEFNTEVELR